MFGGATNYIETLDSILEFVAAQQPTTDELIGWHRGRFERVSSRDSIQRRLDYLVNVGFLERANNEWTLGVSGEEYLKDRSVETLAEIMCRRNLGLRSLLYALSPGSMTIEEINHQQLQTHPELGWSESNTDMAKQRTNWLRSLGLVEKDGTQYRLSEQGRSFTEAAIEQWASDETPATSTDDTTMDARSYEMSVQARSVDPEFRITVLSQYDTTCPISGVDHGALLDVAHILPWNEYPGRRADLSNVLPLSKTHHAAFDRDLITIDQGYRLRVKPTFETDSDLLQRTIQSQAGRQLPIPDRGIDPNYLRQHNERLEWLAD